MVHEYRTYTLHPGRLETYLRLAATKVQQIRRDQYGKLVGFWYSEFGQGFQVHHIWEYESLDHRQESREVLFKRRDWLDEFIADAFPTMQKQEVRFMNPVQGLPHSVEGSALYESRVYSTAVGASAALASAVSERPVSAAATRIGVWTSESPTPNEVVEIVAYRSFQDRLADGVAANGQSEWIRANAPSLMSARSTLLLPISISPLK